MKEKAIDTIYCIACIIHNSPDIRINQLALHLHYREAFLTSIGSQYLTRKRGGKISVLKHMAGSHHDLLVIQPTGKYYIYSISTVCVIAISFSLQKIWVIYKEGALHMVRRVC